MTTLYVAMQGELLVMSDTGGRWRLEAHLAGLNPLCLAADADRPERLYCGTSGRGLYRSDDAGNSWRPVGEGIAHAAVTAVAVGPARGANGEGVVYAGTEPSAVFRSEDGGGSWRELPGLTRLPSAAHWSFPPRPDTHHVRFIGVDPVRPTQLCVCIEAGALVRSRDGGETWEDRRPGGPRDTHTLATHPKAPGRLYSAAGDGYFESRDFGESWESPAEGLEHRYLWSVAVDPVDPDTVLVSAAHGPRQAHNPRAAESVIYRRSGEGSWQRCRSGLPEPGSTMAFELATGAAEGTFYAVCNRGVYRSEDAGESWGPVELDWPDRYLTQRPQAILLGEGAERS
jgi:hypothetical protein